MSDQDKPPPAGYMWMKIDGKWQLVAIGWRAHSEMIRHELAALLAEQEQRTQEQHKPTGEEIVKDYYKVKRVYPKLTLRKYLHDIGMADREGYIRKVKVAYDRRKPGRRKGNTKK